MTIEEIYELSAPTLEDIEVLAREVYDRLPEEFRERCGDVLFRVEDFPDDDVIEEMELETQYDILGLFQGTAITDAQESDPVPREPNIVYLYRRPILDEWSESHILLGDIVTHVLIHEIGHHFGFSDADMERIEAEAVDA
ncbi:MAG: metallopeptidase family protein [Alphaproteobacteria bacterium]|nr:metallopeptidase family protein [Alphaproteobacteria bacterium]